MNTILYKLLSCNNIEKKIINLRAQLKIRTRLKIRQTDSEVNDNNATTENDNK